MDAAERERSAMVEPLDRLVGIFASDAMLSNQFNDLRRSQPGELPIRKLWLAVLEDGIRCFLEGRREGSLGAQFDGIGGGRFWPTRRIRLAEEARAWIFDVEADSAFSFNGLCEWLDINAEYLRDRLNLLATGSKTIPRRSPVLGAKEQLIGTPPASAARPIPQA